MQQGRHRRLLLACLTRLLSGVRLGVSGTASAEPGSPSDERRSTWNRTTTVLDGARARDLRSQDAVGSATASVGCLLVRSRNHRCDPEPAGGAVGREPDLVFGPLRRPAALVPAGTTA